MPTMGCAGAAAESVAAFLDGDFLGILGERTVKNQSSFVGLIV